MDASDQIRRAIAGDGEALASLLGTYGGPIAASLDVAARWRSMVSAEDVMQVTYLEAFLRINDFEPIGPDPGAAFGAWLRRIAENNLRDAIKELSRDKRPPPDRRIGLPANDRSYVELVQFLAGGGATPSREVAAMEATTLIERALESLPEDYARVIRMYELHGQSIREVAAGMNRSEGAVKMLLARARDRMREALGGGGGSRFFSR